MKYRLILSTVITCTLLFTGCAQKKKPVPNVILILADDMGIGDISNFNDGRSNTPNINRLVNEGIWFNQAYSASPVCAPARASLLTGQYPHRTGSVSLNMRRFPDLTRIKKDIRTIADVYTENGYVTGLIGKWHSGIGEGYHPLDRGFQEFEGFYGFHVPSYSEYELIIQDSLIIVTDKYLTNDISDRAIEFVRRHKDESFFLHLSHYAPHRPLGAPVEMVRKYIELGFDENTATIYAMIEVMDQGIGDLLDELDALGIRENTLIIFASDNGPDLLTGKRFNMDLKGTKYMVNEGGIRVPFVVNWPSTILPGVVDEMIHFTDVFPTLVELGDLDVSFLQKTDGISFVSLLNGDKKSLHVNRMWQWNRGVPEYSYNASIRQGDWKLVQPFVSHWTIPFEQSELDPVLYNLANDPEEKSDVSGANPQIYTELRVKLKQWAREVEAGRLKN